MPDKDQPRTVNINDMLEAINHLSLEVGILRVAFEYLAFAIPEERLANTIAALKFEGQNESRDERLREQFKRLADQLEIRVKSQSSLFSRDNGVEEDK
ncbi:hypothetical protein GTU79_11335 [Sodalis ligni]|uniref:hypothetical protein n=1 Tax=Sodalis ligni TaxID=2697027 RepID=UPI00193F1461|nr:hypothetical protein [Sodalis ligni]QWA13191.1 hypothetical protein GTU79_11335 [Sodalis ligni]